jgi:hypothetical protein
MRKGMNSKTSSGIFPEEVFCFCLTQNQDKPTSPINVTIAKGGSNEHQRQETQLQV